MPLTPLRYRVYRTPPRGSVTQRNNPNSLAYAFGSVATDTDIILKIEQTQLDARNTGGYGPTAQIAEATGIRNTQNDNIQINHFIGTIVDNPATTRPAELWKVINIIRTASTITLTLDKEDRGAL